MDGLVEWNGMGEGMNSGISLISLSAFKFSVLKYYSQQPPNLHMHTHKQTHFNHMINGFVGFQNYKMWEKNKKFEKYT